MSLLTHRYDFMGYNLILSLPILALHLLHLGHWDSNFRVEKCSDHLDQVISTNITNNNTD